MEASSFMTLMVYLMDSLRQSMVLLSRTTVVYFGNCLRMPQSSLTRDMGISIAFCFVFLDMKSMKYHRQPQKYWSLQKLYKGCDFYSTVEDYYKQYPEEAEEMGLKIYRNE